MEFDCGTGAGGFKEGNTCATGGDGGDREERRRDRIEGTDEEVKVERQKTNRIISRAKKFIEDGKKYSEAAKRNMDAAATNEKLISKYKEYKDKFNDGKFDKEYSEATKRATEYYKAASEYSQKAKGLFDKALKEEGRARARREKENPEGTAATRNKAGDIEISEANEQALKDKIAEFKKSHPKKNAPSLGTLKKVFRRGAGAFSTSFRPTISGGQPNSRNAWAMARVNKFLKMAGGGEVKESYRKADGDLL